MHTCFLSNKRPFFIYTIQVDSHQFVFFFFFNDTATTEIYTLSLHDALPISSTLARKSPSRPSPGARLCCSTSISIDRKSTRLNSSHANISYAVFCLKKKEDMRATRDSADVMILTNNDPSGVAASISSHETLN